MYKYKCILYNNYQKRKKWHIQDIFDWITYEKKKLLKN
jgi:hypothetical protein